MCRTDSCPIVLTAKFVTALVKIAENNSSSNRNCLHMSHLSLTLTLTQEVYPAQGSPNWASLGTHITVVCLTESTSSYNTAVETSEMACCDAEHGADAFEHDPALADCCRRDLREQAHVQRIKSTLLAHDVTTERLKLAENAYVKDLSAAPCLDTSDRDSLDSDSGDDGKCFLVSSNFYARHALP